MSLELNIPSTYAVVNLVNWMNVMKELHSKFEKWKALRNCHKYSFSFIPLEVITIIDNAQKFIFQSQVLVQYLRNQHNIITQAWVTCLVLVELLHRRFNFVNSLYFDDKMSNSDPLIALIMGSVTGGLSTLIFQPFDVTKTRMQDISKQG